MAEKTYEMKDLRTLHVLPVDHWMGASSSAYWCEWDHWGETPRTLQSIIDTTIYWNWQRFIRPGSTCIDIGGHSGDTAIPLGLMCYDNVRNTRGKVLVVEPNPIIFPIMDINLALNSHIADFVPVHLAITDSDVEAIELADHGNAGCNGGVVGHQYSKEVSNQLESVAGVRYTARGVTISTMLREFGVNPASVAFVKMDCEGYDKEILKGNRDFFAEIKPAIFMEWFDWFTAEDNADLFAAIANAGYVGLNPVTLKPASETEKIADLLCVHKSNLEAGT